MIGSIAVDSSTTVFTNARLPAFVRAPQVPLPQPGAQGDTHQAAASCTPPHITACTAVKAPHAHEYETSCSLTLTARPRDTSEGTARPRIRNSSCCTPAPQATFLCERGDAESAVRRSLGGGGDPRRWGDGHGELHALAPGWVRSTFKTSNDSLVILVSL